MARKNRARGRRSNFFFVSTLTLLAVAAQPAPRPPAASARESLARIEQARARGDLVETRRLCEEALGRDPQNGRIALVLGETLVDLGETRAAQELLTRLIASLPARPEPRRALARAFLAGGKSADALVQAHRAVELDPGSAAGQRLLGLAAQAAGEPEEAISAFERLRKSLPEDAAALRGLAAAYAALEDPRADSLYDKLIASHPRDLPLRVEFAEYLWRKRDYDRGNAVMERVIGAAPDNAKLKAHYGVNLAQQSRFAAAAEQLEAAANGGFRDPDVYFYLGSALWETGRLSEAASRLREAVALAPDRAEARHRLGALLLLVGESNGAIPELARAAALDPKSAPIQVDLGRALEAAGRLPEAEAAYRKALELDSGLSQAHYVLGALLTRTGRRDEAQTHMAVYQAAFAREQERRLQAGARQAELNLGWTELARNRPAEALEQFRRRPGDPEALRGAAAALSRLGRHGEAVKSLESALALDPENRVLRYELARQRSRIGSR